MSERSSRSASQPLRGPIAWFRGDSVGYCVFHMEDEAMLTGTWRAQFRSDAFSAMLPLFTLPADGPNGCLAVICFPLIPEGESLELRVLPQADCTGDHQPLKTVSISGTALKWRSRLDHRVRKGIAERVKGCEQRSKATHALVRPIAVCPLDENELIVRAEATIPCTEGAEDWSLRTIADGRSREESTLILKDVTEQDGQEALRIIAVSCRIPRATENLSIIAESADDAVPGFAIGMLHQNLEGWLGGFFAATEDARLDPAYPRWFAAHRVTDAELERQRNTPLGSQPLFSIIMPVSKPTLSFLKEAVASVQAQSYANWELILSGHLEKSDPVLAFLRGLDDERIRFAALDANGGIVGNTNHGIRSSAGGYVCFLDQDDLLEPDALYRYAACIDEEPETDLIYCDEDTFDGCTRMFSQPLFKMDFNPDLLYSYNYIGHFLCVSRHALDRITLSDENTEGAQDYDLTLKASEAARRIAHIPRILYHRRAHDDSTNSGNTGAEPYAIEAGKRALDDCLRRRGIRAAVQPTPMPFVYETRFAGDPEQMTSIIIPNKDHLDHLIPCIESIKLNAGDAAYEIIIVENNSTDAETFAYYQLLQEDADHLVRTVRYEGAFNYSKIINFGVQHAQGSHLLLLNNDTVIRTPDFLTRMQGYFQRPEVSVVGPLLLYPDELIQEAGLALTKKGWLAFLNQNHSPKLNGGYLGCSSCSCNFSAVLGACQMVRRTDFLDLGGYDEDLAVTFNDVDFCWRMRETGKLVVFTPYTQVIHKEYGSRGSDTANNERAQQTELEAKIMRQKWPERFIEGDPIWNPNLDPNSPYFKLGPVQS